MLSWFHSPSLSFPQAEYISRSGLKSSRVISHPTFAHCVSQCPDLIMHTTSMQLSFLTLRFLWFSALRPPPAQCWSPWVEQAATGHIILHTAWHRIVLRPHRAFLWLCSCAVFFYLKFRFYIFFSCKVLGKQRFVL